MEPWVPLFDIFMNSPTPETDASVWLQRSFSATSSSSTSSPITTSSFISLLTKPCDVTINDSSCSSSPVTKTVMLLQTLPDFIQSRILSFLTYDDKRFCARDLSGLARDVLSRDSKIEFWVEKAARNLLDKVSESNFKWISGLNMDSEEQKLDEDFDSLPDWLKQFASTHNESLLSWLPVSPAELNSRFLFDACENENDEDSMSETGASVEKELSKVVEETEIDFPIPLRSEIEEAAVSLRARITTFESSLKTIGLANEIRQLCLDKGGDSFAILGLIEPWNADDETASVLISNLSNESDDELSWPSQALCSVILPKLLVLEESASRVLISATIEYCKVYHKAAVYALLLPLILRKEGINNYMCDVITRILRECLHPGHVSAICQKLLCGGEDERRVICLPCQRCLISSELVWTESLFTLLQNILNHNVQLTQDSVDNIVDRVLELAERFSKSLKLGNFVLCFITKCAPLLKSHKLLLMAAVENTNTIVTKSILSKLATF